jgi:hypothetical protein
MMVQSFHFIMHTMKKINPLNFFKGFIIESIYLSEKVLSVYIQTLCRENRFMKKNTEISLIFDFFISIVLIYCNKYLFASFNIFFCHVKQFNKYAASFYISLKIAVFRNIVSIFGIEVNITNY